jgi:hypothetical protein
MWGWAALLVARAGRLPPASCLDHYLLDQATESMIAIYLGRAEPVIAPPALAHGIDRLDILHAYTNPLRIWDVEDGFTMTIGPSWSARILEIGYVDGGDAMVILHAMPAREKFLR